MAESLSPRDVYRLSAWLSPAFPVGAYTYSSGLEYAVEAGLVADGDSLGDWLSHLLRQGAGRVDGIFFCHAWRAAHGGDSDALETVVEWADAMRPTAELVLESAAQGEAFLKTARETWPHPALEDLSRTAGRLGRKPAYAVAVGVLCGGHGVPLAASLSAFLHAVTANLVSAGIRLVPLGQTTGQRVLAALAPVMEDVVAAVPDLPLEEAGAATPTIDWASMRHETQYTRLFRS